MSGRSTGYMHFSHVAHYLLSSSALGQFVRLSLNEPSGSCITHARKPRGPVSRPSKAFVSTATAALAARSGPGPAPVPAVATGRGAHLPRPADPAAPPG